MLHGSEMRFIFAAFMGQFAGQSRKTIIQWKKPQ
jgi:hypothetical protein